MFKQFFSQIIVYNVVKKIIEMKISKKFEPLINGLAAGFVIAILALLTFESPFGVWLMFSFGSSALIVFVFYDSEFAQPRNIFFGHLLAICIGILINSLLGVSFFSLGLSVALSVALMIYLKIIHPPAAANPLIAIFADVSYDFILFPVIAGSIILILLSILINKFLFKRKYPKRFI